LWIEKTKAAGEALTVKQVPHRPGITPALGLRARNNVFPLYRRPQRNTETPGVLFIVEALIIDPESSTGRFAGATGGFRVERLYDGGNPGLTFGSFAGTISVPGAGGR
jgi:hypothetical protein